MNVISQRKSFWFFLQDEDSFFLDVNSGSSFVGYSITFQLSAIEVESYQTEGEYYLEQLAHKVNDTQAAYLDRQKSLGKTTPRKIYEAIMTWKTAQKSQ